MVALGFALTLIGGCCGTGDRSSMVQDHQTDPSALTAPNTRRFEGGGIQIEPIIDPGGRVASLDEMANMALHVARLEGWEGIGRAVLVLAEGASDERAVQFEQFSRIALIESNIQLSANDRMYIYPKR